MSIEQIVNYEVAEFIRFIGAVVGTEGIDEKVKAKGNEQLFKLLSSLDTNVDKAVANNRSQNAGLIK